MCLFPSDMRLCINAQIQKAPSASICPLDRWGDTRLSKQLRKVENLNTHARTRTHYIWYTLLYCINTKQNNPPLKIYLSQSLSCVGIQQGFEVHIFLISQAIWTIQPGNWDYYHQSASVSTSKPSTVRSGKWINHCFIGLILSGYTVKIHNPQKAAAQFYLLIE